MGAHQTLYQLLREVEREREDKLCVVCQDREKCIMILPCRWFFSRTFPHVHSDCDYILNILGCAINWLRFSGIFAFVRTVKSRWELTGTLVPSAGLDQFLFLVSHCSFYPLSGKVLSRWSKPTCDKFLVSQARYRIKDRLQFSNEGGAESQCIFQVGPSIVEVMIE